MRLKAIQDFIEREFPTLVVDTEVIDHKIRVSLLDESYINDDPIMAVKEFLELVEDKLGR